MPRGTQKKRDNALSTGSSKGKGGGRRKHFSGGWEALSTKRIGDQLSILGLRLRGIPGDGNCLFGSFAFLDKGDSSAHSEYRSSCISFMKNNPDSFIPFLLEEDLKEMGVSDYDSYLDEMGKPGVWGGNLELLALSQSLSRSVVVHQLGEQPYVMSAPGGDANPFHVAYDGQHYDAIVGTLTVPPSPTPLTTTSSSPSIGDTTTTKPSAKEVSVLNAFPDSDLSLTLVRGMLEKHKGRVDDAIEALIEEQSGGGGGGGVESPALAVPLAVGVEGGSETKVETNPSTKEGGGGGKVSKGPSRNKPCPCGSKKPFKACCSLKPSLSQAPSTDAKHGTSPSELSIRLGGISI